MTWTEKEIQFLRNNHKTMKQKDMLEHLPGRGKSGLGSKMIKLGLKRREMWTSEQIKYLKEHYSNYSMDDIQAHLKMPINKIHQKASQLKITGDRWGINPYRGAKGRNWSTVIREVRTEKKRVINQYKTRVREPETLKCIKLNRRTWLYIDTKKTEIEENTIISYYQDVLTHKSNFIKGRAKNFITYKKAG